MSPLTKMFVVLHVVLSLLLSAGLIVFVNRVESFRTSLASQQARVATLERGQADAIADAASARQSADASALLANSKISDLEKQVNDAQKATAEKDAQLATANTQLAIASAANTKADEALAASEKQKTGLLDTVAQLRKDFDTLTASNNQLNLAVSDLTRNLETTERQRRAATEQLAQVQTQVDTFRKLMVDKGISPSQPGGLAAGAVPINGVVRTVQVVNEIPYATISVGSSDNVQPGMSFNVIDRDRGEFLGKLTVNSVEPTSATGKLEGPHVNEVRVGTEVRTQL